MIEKHHCASVTAFERERIPADDEPRRGRPLVECKVCRMPKAPRGRDAGTSANGYCAHECPGHWCDPQPDYLWPGEEDFAC